VRSVDYIETNLRNPLTVEEIASQSAYYSLYHFVRLFRILTGETPGSYLRKRRLAEAARELVEGDRTILEIALDYQFQSHEAFTRSFKQHFGIAPNEQRRSRQFLHLTSRVAVWDEGTSQPACEPPMIIQKNGFLAGYRHSRPMACGYTRTSSRLRATLITWPRWKWKACPIFQGEWRASE
jgi:AraC-like DNA-binding protein